MTLKAFYRDEALLRAVLARDPQLKRRSDALRDRPLAATQNERIALGRDVAAAVEDQRRADEQVLLDPLPPARGRRGVQPAAQRAHGPHGAAARRRDRRAELDQPSAALGASTATGSRFRYVGPLAPFSFCDLALEMPEEPWG